MSVSSLAKCLIVTLVLAACGQMGGGLVEHPQTPEARADSVSVAVADVVGARCDLEERCTNLGAGRKYDSRDQCESKMQGTTASELNTQDCPLGVDPNKLDVCLASIRAEECGSVFDSMSRWNACRKGQICYQ